MSKTKKTETADSNFNDLAAQVQRKIRERSEKKPTRAKAKAEGTTDAAPAEGWMFPNQSHLAHWGDGQSVLCGRSVPAGTPVEPNSDPAAYAERTCAKCRKALRGRGVKQPEAEVPAVGSTAPVEEAAQTPQAASVRPTVAAPASIETAPTLELTPVEVVPVPVQPLAVEGRTHTVPWNRLAHFKEQPRKFFEPVSLRELAIDIKRRGLLSPLLVRSHPSKHGYYEIAAGERRFRALELLVQGKIEVGDGEDRETLYIDPDYAVEVMVRDLSDIDMLEIGLRENLHREDLRPLERADGFAALKRAGRTPSQICAGTSFEGREVIRAIQISENLVHELREPFDTGILSRAQVEQLILAGPQLQRVLWSRHIQADPKAFPVKKIRALMEAELFPVERAMFPLTMYKGVINNTDLFNDLKAHFADKKAALELQITHVVSMAKAAFEEGDWAFAEVVIDGEEWWYEKGGNGVAYNVNSKTGEVTIWEKVGDRNYNKASTKPPARFASKHDQRHESATPKPAPTPPSKAKQTAASQVASAASPAPAAPPVAPAAPAANQPKPLWGGNGRDLLHKLMFNRGLNAAIMYAPQLTVAAALLNLDMPHKDDFLGTNAAEMAGVISRIKMALGDLASNHEQQILYVSQDGFASEEAFRNALLQQLMSIPATDLIVLAYAIQIKQGLEAIHPDLSLVQATGGLAGLRLTKGFLLSCNQPALEQLYREAELGDPEGLGLGELRKALLGAAEGLAAQGFVPSFLTAEVSA